ncbi:imidazoleglycerol-phosphate dehydratase HisB [Anaerolinea sp.]|uniref:imidazoleglycerol-phosphate dehydratase HisB n=1 Tax=Anaerolinea sp. TaxID=1872519 RepID=UPI003A0FC73D
MQGGSGETVYSSREVAVERNTGETQVKVRLNLDGSGVCQIQTGLGFLDHMLEQVAVHGLFDLWLQASGDLHIDPHHTVEDVALTLGMAFQQAMGDRKGIVRMASFTVPMDESLAMVALDFSGRPFCVFDALWNAPEVGGIPVTLMEHFFQSFAQTARCTLHARVLYGRDDHHRAEALFKALGRALAQAAQVDARRQGKVPSSKGVLV